MNPNHIHLGVRDLPATIDWLDRVWELKPQFQNDRMATIHFDPFILIFDAADADSPATIGFESNDCDRDFRMVVERGTVALDPPSDKPWGSRSAYVQGPGCLKFEIEEPAKRVRSPLDGLRTHGRGRLRNSRTNSVSWPARFLL